MVIFLTPGLSFSTIRYIRKKRTLTMIPIIFLGSIMIPKGRKSWWIVRLHEWEWRSSNHQTSITFTFEIHFSYHLNRWKGKQDIFNIKLSYRIWIDEKITSFHPWSWWNYKIWKREYSTTFILIVLWRSHLFL